MEKTCCADSKRACKLPQSPSQICLDVYLRMGDSRSIPLDIQKSKGRCGLADLLEHVPEEGLVLFLAHPHSGLGHKVAERQRRGQQMNSFQHMRLNLRVHHGQCGVVAHEVMKHY